MNWLADSHARLGWVDELGRRVAVLGMLTIGRIREAGLAFDEKVVDDKRFLRVRLADSSTLPPAEMGFLVGDFAVNARSCLDMAVHQLVERLGVNWRQGQPYYLLCKSTDPGEVEKRKKSFAGQGLPRPYVEAITGLQPRETPWDLTAGLTGVELCQLSNATKHRCLTTVVRSTGGRGFGHPTSGGDSFELAGPEAPWPKSNETIMVMRAPSTVPVEAFHAARPTADVELRVAAGPDVGIELTESYRDWIEPVDFVTRTVKFVSLALRRLEQAQTAIDEDRHPEFSDSLSV